MHLNQIILKCENEVGGDAGTSGVAGTIGARYMFYMTDHLFFLNLS